MLLKKTISVGLTAVISFCLIFSQSVDCEFGISSSIPDESISNLIASDYSHLPFNERFKYIFDQEDDFDPAIDAAIESDYKERQLRECADAILSNSKIADYIDIQDFYSTKPQFRLESDETLSTYVFQNADGSNTTYYLAENVKYISEDGTICEKDIQLKQKEDGYYINDSDFKIRIAQSPLDGVDLDTVLGTIKTCWSSLKDENSLAETVFSKEENSVTYNDLFGTGVHLKLMPLLSGIEEDIIFEREPDRNSYSITIDTNNLVASQKDGIISLYSKSAGNDNLFFGQVYIYDAKGYFFPVEAKLDLIDERGSYSYTVFLPDGFWDNSNIVFPVTVSSKIQVRSGLNSNDIVDASVYQNVPNMNAGSWAYNNIGYTDSTYGLARTLIKLEGMLDSLIYQNLTASNITSVYFKAREATGNSYKQVKIHPMTGTPIWTESTVTWNNYGSFDTGADFGGSIGYDEWASFDITNLVKAWKINSYNGNGCFIFVMGGTENSASRALYSSEYSASTTYRPYVQMTYQNPYLSLMYTNLTIEKGKTVSELAVIDPYVGTVTWEINLSAVASAVVSPSTANICYISGLQPGKAVLTAKLYYGTVLMTSAFCNVTVILPQGVYYIRSSNYVNNYVYIRTDGTINNNASLYQRNIGNVIMPEYVKVQYLWKIKYLGSDRYSIRSMMKSDKGIVAGNSNSVVLSEIGTFDNLSQLNSSQKWGISWDSTAGGVIISKDLSTTQVIKGSNNSLQPGVTLVTGNITPQSSWTFIIENDPPEGVSFYKSSDGTYYPDPVFVMIKDEMKTLQELEITPAVYSTETNTQTVSWVVNTQSAQFVNISPDGTVLAKKPGIAVISAESVVNTSLAGTFTVDVAPFKNGFYFMQNVDSTKFLYASTASAGTNLATENFINHNQAKWKLEYEGDSYYTIKWFSNLNFYAGVENDSNSNNTNIELRSGNITDGMRWKFEDDGNGRYTITPKCAEQVNRHMNNSGSSVKLSGATGATSKWMIWNSGDLLLWSPSCWYSDENEIWYWNKQTGEDILIFKDIEYEGLARDYDTALSFSTNGWEYGLDISTDITLNNSEIDISFRVKTKEDLEAYFGVIHEFDDPYVMGVVPLDKVTKIKIGYGVFPGSINRVITVYQVIKAEIAIRTDSVIPYCEDRVAAHELGHALGFFGHIISNGFNDNCIMNQGHYEANPEFSNYDYDHLAQIYN